jgi:hypothetical protein
MKNSILILACSVLCTGFLAAADKETTTTTKTKTTTTHSTGTITEYTPGTTFVVKETDGPVTYKYGKHVTYVTKSGKEIPEGELKTRIKVGSPVSVDYATEGDTRIINKVVIDD